MIGIRVVQSDSTKPRSRALTTWCAAADAAHRDRRTSLRYNSSSVSNGSTPATSQWSRVADLHQVRLDRRVGDELRLPSVSAQSGNARGESTPCGRADVECGVRAVQRHPAAALLDPLRGSAAAPRAGSHVARVADEDRAGRDGIGVFVVGLHPDAELVVLAEQLRATPVGRSRCRGTSRRRRA